MLETHPTWSSPAPQVTRLPGLGQDPAREPAPEPCKLTSMPCQRTCGAQDRHSPQAKLTQRPPPPPPSLVLYVSDQQALEAGNGWFPAICPWKGRAQDTMGKKLQGRALAHIKNILVKTGC